MIKKTLGKADFRSSLLRCFASRISIRISTSKTPSIRALSKDEVDMKQATIWRNFRVFVAGRFKSEEAKTRPRNLEIKTW